MAIIKSGASTDQLTVDVTSKAARATLYDSAGRQTSFQSLKVFSCSPLTTFTPPATPTDLLTIIGSATKTVRVWSINMQTMTTAAGSIALYLIKRSTADTGGTAVTATNVPWDSQDSATAVVQHYTANPAALGSVVGTLSSIRVATPVVIPATWAGINVQDGFEMIPKGLDGLCKPITLRGVAEQLAVNFNGIALVAGQVHAYTVVWTEE